MFEPLKDLLSKSAKKKNFSQEIQAYELLEYSHTVVSEVCGKFVSENIKPIHIKNGAITFVCLSSVFAQEILLHRNEIIETINKKSIQAKNKLLVKKIRFIF